jgi:alpha-1,3-rhamnosyl/mannosyltransferase
MKILFDASAMFVLLRGGGVYNYLLKLLPNLAQLAERQGDDFRYFHLYFRQKLTPPEFLDASKTIDFRFPVRMLNKLWINLSVPDLSWVYDDVQIFHSPHFSLPIISKAKKILTVNDITYLKHPEFYTEEGKKLNEYGYRTLLPVNIRRADRVIAISQHTKNDLVEHFNISAEKISVVHIGCDIPIQMEKKNLETMLEQFELKDTEFIYFPVGTFEPRKNIVRTVDAFTRCNPRPGKLKLVISGVGDRRWLSEIKSAKDLVTVQWNNDDEKNALYQGAIFVIYPSLYEGFGMPVVEAMGNRKAVLTSNTSSLKEIAEGFAHTVNPKNTDEIANGLEFLLNDSAYRHELELKSERRAMDFTWDMMAEKTYSIYRDIILA